MSSWVRGALIALALAAWWHALRRGGALGLAVAATVAAVVGWQLVGRLVRAARERFIREAPLPAHLRRKLFDAYPQLSETHARRVEAGLRQFFLAHLRSRRFVGMPSQAADALWHAFILDTRAYARFCERAFGVMLHHSPAETLGRSAKRNDGLRRTWYWCCKEERIDPGAPASLPLLFALDAELAIPNGFQYVPDCRAIDRATASGVHCGTDFGSSGDGDGVPGDAGGYGGEGSHGHGHGDGGGDGSGHGGSDGGGDGGGCGGGD